MLQAIVDWSIRNRLVVVILAGLLLVAWLYSRTGADADGKVTVALARMGVRTILLAPAVVV